MTDKLSVEKFSLRISFLQFDIEYEEVINLKIINKKIGFKHVFKKKKIFFLSMRNREDLSG